MRFIPYVFAVTPEEILYGYGPLGIGVVALSVVGLRMFNILLKDRDKAIEDRDTIIQDLFTKVLPAITRNTDVLEDRQSVDRDLVSTIKDSTRQLEENTRALDEVRYLLKFGRTENRMGGG